MRSRAWIDSLGGHLEQSWCPCACTPSPASTTGVHRGSTATPPSQRDLSVDLSLRLSHDELSKKKKTPRSRTTIHPHSVNPQLAVKDARGRSHVAHHLRWHSFQTDWGSIHVQRWGVRERQMSILVRRVQCCGRQACGKVLLLPSVSQSLSSLP